MKLFKKPCVHEWKIREKTNALQLDHMGYPLRLCLVKCSKCSESGQRWIDVPLKELEELKTGESFLLEWR